MKRKGFTFLTVLFALACLISITCVSGFYDWAAPGSVRKRLTDNEIRMRLLEIDRVLIRWYYTHLVYTRSTSLTYSSTYLIHYLPASLDLSEHVTHGSYSSGTYGDWGYNMGLANLAIPVLNDSRDDIKITYTRVSDSEYTLTAVSQEDDSALITSPMSGIDLEEDGF